MKKLLIIFLGLIVVALAVFLLTREKTVTPKETFSAASPFGKAEDINIPATGDLVAPAGEETGFDEITSEDLLFRVSNTPVAGYVVFQRKNEEVVRFADRGTGHISEANLSAKGRIERVKITNQTLPKIYEAIFRPDGGAVLYRSLENDSDTVNNLSLALTAPKASSSTLYSVTATSLRGNMDSVTTLGNSLLYVLKDNSSISTANFAGESVKALFSSAFTNWRLGKVGNNVLAYPKASASASGYAYLLPAGGGQLTRLVGPHNGLTAVASANGGKLLYSFNDRGTIKLFTKTLQSGSVSEILPATLSEKCVWSVKSPNKFYCGSPITPISGNEPDNWYLGFTHTSDYVWSYDTDSETALLISEPKTEFDLDIDVYKPALSPQEDFLVFMNRRDQTLWAVRLK